MSPLLLLGFSTVPGFSSLLARSMSLNVFMNWEKKIAPRNCDFGGADGFSQNHVILHFNGSASVSNLSLFLCCRG